MSATRLAAAVALIRRHLGSVAGRPRKCMRSVETAMSAARNGQDATSAGATTDSRRRSPGRDDESIVPDARIREITYRRWIDDPDQRLGGMSPREAAAHDAYRVSTHRRDAGRAERGMQRGDHRPLSARGSSSSTARRRRFGLINVQPTASGRSTKGCVETCRLSDIAPARGELGSASGSVHDVGFLATICEEARTNVTRCS